MSKLLIALLAALALPNAFMQILVVTFVDDRDGSLLTGFLALEQNY